MHVYKQTKRIRLGLPKTFQVAYCAELNVISGSIGLRGKLVSKKKYEIIENTVSCKSRPTYRSVQSINLKGNSKLS